MTTKAKTSSQYVYNEKYVLQGQRETSKDG